MPRIICMSCTCFAHSKAHPKALPTRSEHLRNAECSRGFEGIEHAASSGSAQAMELVLWFTKAALGTGQRTFGSRPTL